MITFAAILLLSAGYFNGVMDQLSFKGGDQSPHKTWKDKYKQDAEGNPIPTTKPPWYYLGLYTPKYIEAFPFSSTALVGFTDPWHRNKLLCFASIRTALILMFSICTNYNVITYICVWVGLWALQALGFHIKYTWIK